MIYGEGDIFGSALEGVFEDCLHAIFHGWPNWSKGWSEWSGDFALSTLYYAEFANWGPGSNTSNRVTWEGYHLIDEKDADDFTVHKFIQGDKWLPQTGVPFKAGFQWIFSCCLRISTCILIEFIVSTRYLMHLLIPLYVWMHFFYVCQEN